jgi:hypothetical protein
MSPPAKPPASAPESSLQPTRQLLDELDSLMQRMLALPVERVGGEPGEAPGPATAAATDEEERPVYRPPSLNEMPAAANYRETEWEEDAPSDRLADRPQSLPSEQDASLPASPEVLAALHLPARQETSRRPIIPTTQPAADVPEPLPAAWLRALVRTNQVFDYGTTWLGGPGQWLRSDRGRALLGWVGLGLLAGAVAWLTLTGLGWTW